MNELRLWDTTSNKITDTNIMIFTETWLRDGVPDCAVGLQGRHCIRSDRTADCSKSRGGGLCICINRSCCTDNLTIAKHCSANIEFLMVKNRPFYLPREFNSIITIAAYIPPDANAKLAMTELHAAISNQQTQHPETAFIIAGDFNHSNLKTVLAKFYQHVSCPKRGDKTHVYTIIKEAYKALPLPELDQSDHISRFLLPKYHPLMMQVKPSVKSVKVWPEGADFKLQHRLHTNWSDFAVTDTVDPHTDIDSYTSSVLDYIKNNINDIATIKRITIFPNQKP